MRLIITIAAVVVVVVVVVIFAVVSLSYLLAFSGCSLYDCRLFCCFCLVFMSCPVFCPVNGYQILPT